MKKYLFFAAAATILASCTTNEVIGDGSYATGEGTAISFNGVGSATTRADYAGADAAAKLKNNFIVYGVKGDGSNRTLVFDHYNVNYVASTANTTTSNTNDWEYVAQAKHDLSHASAQTIKYWDYSASQYDFVAFSAGEATDVTFTAVDKDNLTYTIKGDADNLAKVYVANLETAYSPDDYKTTVQFKFRSLSAKVRLALYEIIPGYSVKDVVFYTDKNTRSTDGKAALFTEDSYVFNANGTYTVSFPTIGSTNASATDYNKAHLAFEADATGGTTNVKTLGALIGFKGAQGTEAAGEYLGRTSAEATYAKDDSKDYTVVLPNETGAELNLKVDYTLVSTDGSGETINVTGATAKVPKAFAAWKSGYAYTYIFKISQDTNGETAEGKAGLYPITFDAVVTETEDGIQETITTVSEPSITTYAKDAAVTANNEYKKGNNIYVSVFGVTLNATNSALYTVTIEEGAAQTINEASVANALAQGGTVKDANEKTLTVAAATGLEVAEKVAAADAPDGNEFTINGMKFKPEAAAIYAFEYIDGTKKHYKIIKVVE